MSGQDPAEPITDGCAGVDAVGVDLTRLWERREVAGAVEGYTAPAGVYRAGVLTVTDQSDPQPDRQPNLRGGGSRRPPCPPPPGGWYLGEEGDSAPMFRYIEQHATVFGPIRLTYAADISDGSTPARGVVFVLGVANGDLAEVKRSLRNLYPHNLCLVRATASNADLTEVKQRLDPMSRDPRIGMLAYGPGILDLVILDQHVYDQLQPIGIDKLRISPWMYPATTT